MAVDTTGEFGSIALSDGGQLLGIRYSDGGGRELTGSAAVGMHAVLLAGPDWHGHYAYDRESDWAGPRISSLEELLR